MVNRELERKFIYYCSYWIAETRRVQVGKKPRLWCALFQCFKWQLMFHGFLFAVEVHVQKTRDIIGMPRHMHVLEENCHT